MMLRAQQKLVMDLAFSLMVGDRRGDIEAGRRVGCRTVLIGEGCGERFPCAPTVRVASRERAALGIIQQSRLERGRA
jgi:histidinol phosphatase-like enzyme